MSIIKINRPQSAQIFYDSVVEDAAQVKRESDARWRNRVLDAIAAVVKNARR
jgi:hypothetical protein